MNKIAIVRGPHLNKWEMQTYELLTDSFDITAYTTYDHIYDIDSIIFKKRFFHTPNDIIKFFPTRRLKHYAGRILTDDIAKDKQYMYGLDKVKNQGIFHTCDSYSWSHQCLLSKRRYGGKIAVTVWQNLAFQNDPCFNSRFIKEALIKEADYFLPVTKKAAEALIAEGADSNKISVVYPGIDMDKFKPEEKNKQLAKQYGIEDKFTILFIGRLVWQKGIYNLLNIAKHLNGYQFIVVGDGPEKEKFLFLKEKLKVDNLIYIPVIPYHSVPDLINLSDIFILPSLPMQEWEEQFGMVLAEVMACGKIVLASKTGAIPEVIGDAGFLFSAHNSYEAINIINNIDKNIINEYGAKARARVEQLFNAKKQSKKIKDIYNNLL